MPIATEPHYHIWGYSENGKALEREPLVYRSRTPAYRAIASRGIIARVYACEGDCGEEEHPVCPTCGRRLYRG